MQFELSKGQLRKTLLSYRRLLAQPTFESRNQAVCEHVLSLVKSHQPSSVHVFMPIQRNKEVVLEGLLPHFWKSGIKVLTSATDFKQNKLKHFLLTSETILKENHLDIPEPVGAEFADLERADMIFVPMICGDQKFSRIGYGGGYYDRILSETNALKVGLLLAPLLDEITQKDTWDVSLDFIITPNEIIKNYG